MSQAEMDMEMEVDLENSTTRALDNWLQAELQDFQLLTRVVPELYMMVVFQCFREQFAQDLPATLRFLRDFGYLPEHFLGDFDASVAFVARLWTVFTGNSFYEHYPLRFELMPQQSIVFPWYVASPELEERCTPVLIGQVLGYTAPNEMLLLVLRQICSSSYIYYAHCITQLSPLQVYLAKIAFRLTLYEHFCRHIRESLMIRPSPVNIFQRIEARTRRITADNMDTPGFRDGRYRLNLFYLFYDFEAIRAEDLVPTSAFMTQCRAFMADVSQVDWIPPPFNANRFRPNGRPSVNRALQLKSEHLPPEWTEFLFRMSILSIRPVRQDLLRLFMGSMLMQPIQPPVSEMVQWAQSYARAFNMIAWLKALLEPTWQAYQLTQNRRDGQGDGGQGGGGQGERVANDRPPPDALMPPPNAPPPQNRNQARRDQHRSDGSNSRNHRQRLNGNSMGPKGLLNHCASNMLRASPSQVKSFQELMHALSLVIS